MALSGGPTVPMSKHQLGSHEVCFETLSPGSGELHTARCTILEVYDQETIDRTDAPTEIAKQLERFPNKLFAKVRLHDGRILFRPFRDPQSQVYSTFGNSALLQGTPAKIVFQNARVREGHIICTDDLTGLPANMGLATEAWDIGMLV